MLTTTQAATHLGVAVRTIQLWITQKKLPAQKMGRDWLIAEADLEAFTPPLMGRPKKQNDTPS